MCPYFHSLLDGTRRKGRLNRIECPVKFHFLTPILKGDSRLSTNHFVIVSEGEHNHPPPPMRRIAPDLKDKVIDAVKGFGLAEATARKLVASSFMPIILNGEEDLTYWHLALLNQSVVNHIIRTERAKEHPLGTDFLGVQHQLTRQDPNNPYIRSATMYPDGKFILHCQSKDQSRLLFEAHELHIDKTFKRTDCHEFEMNVYSDRARHLGTIARVFMDSDDELAYYRAMKAICDTAEQDVHQKLPWAHLTPEKLVNRIKAILVDEHGGQIKGLGRYFEERYPQNDAASHVLKIVKTCQVHYERSVMRLETQGVPSRNPTD